MKEYRIVEALSIIGDYIQEYENADNPEELFASQIEREKYKSGMSLNILTALKVLNAVTGKDYHWTRRELENGTFYSGVCEVTTTGKQLDLTENYAQEQQKKSNSDFGQSLLFSPTALI